MPCWPLPARATTGAPCRCPTLLGIARTPAFWQFARQHWRTGIREMYGSLSKHRFVEAARA